MNEVKIKHLEFVQNIITRMNTNSFQIKTFTVTVLSVLLAIYVTNKNDFLLLIPICTTILFWFLDTFYLQQERKFRGVYNSIIRKDSSIKINDFELPINKFVGGQFNYWNVFFSKTILCFYGLIILTMAITYVGLKVKIYF